MFSLAKTNRRIREKKVTFEQVLNLRPMPALRRLLHSSNHAVRKQTCWALSNITAGTTEQIQAVISAGIMPFLAHTLLHDRYEIQKEACWAIANATGGSTAEQIRTFVTPHIIMGLKKIAAEYVILFFKNHKYNALSGTVGCGDEGDGRARETNVSPGTFIC